MRRINIFYRLFISIVLSIGLLHPALAQDKEPLVVSSKVDKPSVTVGEILTYTINTNRADNVQVVLPDSMDFDGLEIVEHGVEGPAKKDGHSISNYWYKLRASDVRSYTIPSVTIAYTVAGEPQDKEIKTTKTTVDVKSVIPEGEELKDIVDIKPLEPMGIDYRFWGTIAALILVVVVIAGFFIYRYKHRTFEEEIIPPRPAHEVALEVFTKLAETECVNPQDIKNLYFELSETFRYYLERRYDFPATDWTSEEILGYLNQNQELSFDIKGQCREFLSNTDLVKFAENIPAKNQTDMEIQRAIRFVEDTREVPVEPEESSKES